MTEGRRGLTREALLFVVFGGVQLVADWLTFVVLTWSGVEAAAANLVGRVVGAALGFWLNGRYTFQASPQAVGHRLRQLLRFGAGWAITAALSTVAVYLIERHLGLHAAWAGKLVVDAGIAVLGFVLSKYWIFK